MPVFSPLEASSGFFVLAGCVQQVITVAQKSDNRQLNFKNVCIGRPGLKNISGKGRE